MPGNEGGRLEFSEFGEAADVMDFHRSGLLAKLAPAPVKPGDQLLAGVGGSVRSAVIDDRRLLSP